MWFHPSFNSLGVGNGNGDGDDEGDGEERICQYVLFVWLVVGLPEGVVGEGREDGDDQEGVTFMIDKEGDGGGLAVDVEREDVSMQ